MKKKGFTLIELLAVITLLSLLAIVVVVTVSSSYRNMRKDLSESQKRMIYSATETYIEKYKNDYPMVVGNTYCISLSQLVKEGLLEDKLINVMEDIELDLSLSVKATVESKVNYAFDFDEKEDACSRLVYGIKRRLDAETSTWERIEDSIGLEANAQVGNAPVRNDFDNIYPWSEIISYNYNTETKKITAYYGDENFKFDGTNGEVLTKIPAFYYKRSQDDEYEYIYISKIRREGYEKSEEFSVGRYTMSKDSTGVHSKSGYKPLRNTTITDFRNYAKNLGAEFGQLDYHYFLLQILYLVEYADYDSQLKLGLGYTEGTYVEPIQSGGCDTLGMKSGSVDGTGNTSMIYRGIEDIFGNIWQFIDGINIRNGQIYVCYDKNQYQKDTFGGCYKEVGYMNASANGYASKIGYDAVQSMIMIPVETKGSANMHMADYFYASSLGDRMIFVGGRHGNSDKCGMWNWNFTNDSSQVWDHLGSRLLKTN